MTEIEILRQALDWRAAGRQVALCTVVATWGSAPKPVGSHLIVDGEGSFMGSVSGGCVEGDVIAEAADVLASGTPRLLDFGVSDGLAWKAGLTCGGQIKVYVEPLGEALASCLGAIVSDGSESRRRILVTALDGGPPMLAGLDDGAEHPLASNLAEVFRTGKSQLVEHEDRRFLLTVFVPPARLVVFGAVHIAQALSTIASLAGMEMTVVDPRSAFATPERFPGIRVVTDWPSEVAAAIDLKQTDAVAALSHDPRIDDQGLQLALAAQCFYVGALGSRRSHARRLDRLRDLGVAEHDLRRIHGPIGLDIGAEGPAEIAVSILAEIIAVRNGLAQRSASSDAA